MSEPLVLLPGMSADARVFWPQIAALSGSLTLMIAPVTRGERIEEIASGMLASLPSRFALVGHGLGGVVALELLRRAPERITRLVLISTTPLPDTPDQAAAREPHIVAARSGRLADVLRETLPAHALAPGEARAAVLAQMSRMGLDLGAEVFVRQSRAMQRRRDAQSILMKITQPVLLISGAHDAIVPLKRQEFMEEMIPSARLEVIADAGYLPMLEQPQAVTRLLHDFMAQKHGTR